MAYPYFTQWMDPSLLAGVIYHFYTISLVTVHNSGLSITAVLSADIFVLLDKIVGEFTHLINR